MYKSSQLLAAFVLVRLAINIKFPIRIHIHIDRFSVNIHGYIHIHRCLSCAHVARPYIFAKFSTAKASIPLPAPKNMTQIFPS